MFSAKEQIVIFPSVLARLIVKVVDSFALVPGNVLTEFAAFHGDLDRGADYRVIGSDKHFVVIEYSNPGFRTILKLRRGSTDLRVHLQIISNEAYRALINLVNQFMDPREVRYVVDAGANIGLTTLYLHSYFQNARFVCVEPDPGSFAVLMENITRNEIGSIELFNGGVWGETKVVSVNSDFRDGREWAVSLTDKAPEVAGDSRETRARNSVNVVTMNDLMQRFNFPRIDILKMDIEGGEFSVFHSSKSASEILDKTSFLAIEIHDDAGPRSQIENYLANSGFVYFTVGETTFGVNPERAKR